MSFHTECSSNTLALVKINNLLSGLLRGFFLIDERAVSVYMPRIENFLTGDLSASEEMEAKHKRMIEDARPKVYLPNDPTPYTMDNAPHGGIGVMIIAGPMMKDDWCGTPGTATMKKWMEQLHMNTTIKGIVLHIDSPGGSVDGTGEFADAIAASTKPVVAYGDGLIASAAYWAASQCDYIMLSHATAEIGSIGTAIKMVDYTGMDEANGIVEHYITADGSPDKNKAFMEAKAGKYKAIKTELLNPTNDIFLSAVQSGRKGKLVMSKDEPLTGKVYLANDAIGNGLADGIGTLADAIKKANDLGQKENTTITKNNMKFSIKNSLTSLLGLLGLAASADADHVEAEITPEQLQTINDALPKLAEAQTANDALQAQLTALHGELASMKAALVKPADTTAAVVGVAAGETVAEAAAGVAKPWETADYNKEKKAIKWPKAAVTA